MEVNRYRGMRDFLPDLMRKKKYLISIVEEVFESFGFEPLETPAIELWSTLSGKYGTEEKLIYKFSDRKGREIGLRYDLTVPLARVVAMHNLPLPFKRYQIQPVWRADRPQKGRFREFYQCDIDIVGTDNPLSDAEILHVFIEALKRMGVRDFEVLLNSRDIIKGYGELTGFDEVKIARYLDKIDRMGEDGVFRSMEEEGIPMEVFREISSIKKDGPSTTLLAFFEEKWGNITSIEKGIKELKEIFGYLKMKKIEEFFVFEPYLARGLDYYTGMVFEGRLKGVRIGSIGGGGRYDNLIGLFSGRDIPAVGGSIGLDRLITGMEELGIKLPDFMEDYVFVTVFNRRYMEIYIEICEILRKRGYKVDLYSGDKDMRGQMGYANEKGYRWVIIAGDSEVERGRVIIKNMEKRTQIEISLDDLNSFSFSD